MTGTVVYTIGHGARTLDDFVETLQAAGVAGVIDVRRYPGSRRHPHFGGAALAEACGRAGIAYDALPSLGGRRKAGPLPSPNPGWTVDAFRHYADFMDSAEFAGGLARLLALAVQRPSAVMCAETHPSQCHRRLIADKLVALGHPVVHLITPQRREPHVCPPFLRLDGEHLRYDRAVSPEGQSPLF